MSDTVMAQLSSRGYQPVFLPMQSDGFLPPDVYVYVPEAKALERWGPLKDFEPKVDTIVPRTSVGPKIGTEATRAMSGNVAARFFQGIMKMLGLSEGGAGVRLGFAGSARFRYEFDGITSCYVERSKLIPLIGKTFFGAWVDSEINAGNVHVALEYLYARSIRIKEANGKAFDAAAQAELDKLAQTNLSGKVKREKNGYLTFSAEGPGGAAFAYKAMRVFRFDGDLVIGGHAKALSHEGESDAETSFSEPYVPGAFLDVQAPRPGV